MGTQVDYLTEDQVISSQKFVVMSILSPGFSKNPAFSALRGIKIRGSYETYEDAQSRANHLQKIDSLHNVFIGEVGKWLPFEDDPEKAKDMTYAEGKLNNLMKAYMKNQSEAKELYEQRKNELMMKSISEDSNSKKKKSKKKRSDMITKEDNNLDSSNLNIDLTSLPELDETKSDPGNEDSDQDSKVLKIEEELKKAMLLLECAENQEVEDTKAKKEDLEKIAELRQYCNDMDDAAILNLQNRQK